MNKNESLAEILISSFEEAKSDRSAYDDVYQLITDYVTPFRGDFTSMSIPPNTVSSAQDNNPDVRRMYTSEASSALNQLVSIITNRLTDPTSKWYKLAFNEAEENDSEEGKRFLEKLEDSLFYIFNGSGSGFLEANYEAIGDCVAYGTGAISVVKQGDEIAFKSLPLQNIFIAEDHKGTIDTVFLADHLTARQADQRFGSSKFGESLNAALEVNSSERFEFVQMLMPKKDYERLYGKSPVLSKFDYVSVHLAIKDKKILLVEGFDTLPLIVFRFDKISGEVYGISPSFKCLTDIRLLNQTTQEFMLAAAKLGSPVTMMNEELSMNSLDLSPDGIIIGAINEDGKRLMDHLPINPDLNALMAMMEKLEDKINRAFAVDHFQPRKGVQPLTATETNTIEQNKLVLLSPQVKRIETEYLTKLIHRVITLMSSMEDYKDLFASLKVKELDIRIEYISPLSFTMKSSQLLSYNRFISNAAPLLQADPTSLMNIDIDASVRDMAVKSGMPFSSIKTKAEVDAMKAEIAKQQQEQQQLQNLQLGADATQKLSQSGINPLPQ